SGRGVVQEAFPTPDAGVGAYGYADIEMATPPRAGVWQRVKVEILYNDADGGAKSATASVWIDDVAVLDRAPVRSGAYPGLAYALLGVRFRSPPAAPWTAWFDDVAVDVE